MRSRVLSFEGGSRRGRWARVVAVIVLAVFGIASDASSQWEDDDPPVMAGEGMTLLEAVQEALGRSPDLRSAQAALDVAEQQVREAWGEVYPSIDFRSSYTRNLSPAQGFLPAQIFDPDAAPGELIPVQFGADNTWSMAIDGEQALFRAGVIVGVGAAKRFRNLQEETLRGEAQALVTRVRTAYYDLLLAQEQVRLTENSLRRVRASLEETQALNEAGLASDYDVLRLQVEVANLEPNLRRAENAADDARRSLAVELDVEAMESIQVQGSLASMELDAMDQNSAANQRILAFTGVALGEEADPEALVAVALQQRTDILQLELTETLRQTELRLEQAEYLPEISIFGGYGIDAQENGSLDFFGERSSDKTFTRRIGLQVTLPIFNGFAREARISQKRATMRQAEADTHLARSVAESEIRGLIDDLDEARLRARTQRLAVDQAQAGFDIASAQYREGVGSQLELTDSEVALRETEFNYAEAVYDFLVAQARLDQAVGVVPEVDLAIAQDQ